MNMIVNFFVLVGCAAIVLIFVSGKGNNRTQANRIRSFQVIKHMYDPITTNDLTIPCFWLKKFKPQYKLCMNDHRMAAILLDARKMAVSHCENQFRYNRWNCSRNNKTFKNIYRETAFLYAMAASALTHSVARACAEGKLNNCNCAREIEHKNDVKNWKWGLCNDNIPYGRKFTRKFLQLHQKQRGDNQIEILRHNIKVGIYTVVNNVNIICKCQGLSASCSLKICWKKLQAFNKTALILKDKYQHALPTEFGNTAVTTSRIKINKNRNLYYLKRSPTFCKSTPGRRCLDPTHCSNLCCGRGYNTIMKKKSKMCNCRWKDEFMQLKCDNCSYLEDEFYCKDDETENDTFE